MSRKRDVSFQILDLQLCILKNAQQKKINQPVLTGTNFTPTGTMFGVIFYKNQSIIYIRKILKNSIIFQKKIK